MSKEAQLLKFFVQDIEQDASHYQALHAHLLNQHHAILARDAETINHINHAMTQLVAQLQESSERRSKITAAFKIPANETAVEQLITRLPSPLRETTKQHWESLQSCVTQCKEQNIANGKIMAMHHELLNQLLTDTESPALYTPQYF